MQICLSMEDSWHKLGCVRNGCFLPHIPDLQLHGRTTVSKVERHIPIPMTCFTSPLVPNSSVRPLGVDIYNWSPKPPSKLSESSCTHPATMCKCWTLEARWLLASMIFHALSQTKRSRRRVRWIGLFPAESSFLWALTVSGNGNKCPCLGLQGRQTSKGVLPAHLVNCNGQNIQKWTCHFHPFHPGSARPTEAKRELRP